MIDRYSEFNFVVTIHVPRSVQRLVFGSTLNFLRRVLTFVEFLPAPCISMKVNLPAGQGSGVAVPAVQ